MLESGDLTGHAAPTPTNNPNADKWQTMLASFIVVEDNPAVPALTEISRCAMSTSIQFNLFSMQLSVRFIQGYRYLDRCGECLIRLEAALEHSWIPVETSPNSGSMKNEAVGLSMIFNSEGLNVRQAEYLAFELFQDQSCKAYDVLWRTLEIERIARLRSEFGTRRDSRITKRTPPSSIC